MPHAAEPLRHDKKLVEGLAHIVHRMWSPAIRMLGPLCSRIVELVDHWWLFILCTLSLLTAAVVLWDVFLYYESPKSLDWLWITGYPIGLFVLFRSSGLPDRIYYLRHSLINQGILDVYDPEVSPAPSLARERNFDTLDEAGTRLLEEMKSWVLPHTAVMTIAICALANYVIHEIGLYRQPPPGAGPHEIFNIHANHILGHIYILLVSLRLGRVVSFSILMWAHGLVRLHIEIEECKTCVYRIRLDPQPGHPDGVCGLRNILDFWTFEASLLIAPLIYALFWLAISSSGYCATNFWSLCDGAPAQAAYSTDVSSVYLKLSMIFIALQLLSLWWPLLALRMHMGHARNAVKARLDQIVKKTAGLRYEIEHSTDPAARKEAAERLGQALEAYKDYQSMPLWPVSRAVLTNHVAQLWTVLVFLGVINKDDKIWTAVKAIFLSSA